MDEISLDHDLGLATSVSERTGNAVLAWLEEAVAPRAWEHPLPEMHIHSANPVGRQRMAQAIETIRRLAEAQ